MTNKTWGFCFSSDTLEQTIHLLWLQKSCFLVFLHLIGHVLSKMYYVSFGSSFFAEKVTSVCRLLFSEPRGGRFDVTPPSVLGTVMQSSSEHVWMFSLNLLCQSFLWVKITWGKTETAVGHFWSLLDRSCSYHCTTKCPKLRGPGGCGTGDIMQTKYKTYKKA